ISAPARSPPAAGLPVPAAVVPFGARVGKADRPRAPSVLPPNRPLLTGARVGPICRRLLTPMDGSGSVAGVGPIQPVSRRYGRAARMGATFIARTSSQYGVPMKFRTPRPVIPMAVLALLALIPDVASAAAAMVPAEEGLGLDGSQLGLLWVIPFAGILLSIALFPLFAPNFWHHHFGKVSAFWGMAVLIPMLIAFGPAVTTYEVLHVYLGEYIPFIILLLALFTISGGVRLKGQLSGSPEVNVGILA